MNNNNSCNFNPDEVYEGEYVEFTENSLNWGNDVHIPAGSYYRYDSYGKWKYADRDLMVYLCCSGDYFEIVRPGPPSKRIVFRVI